MSAFELCRELNKHGFPQHRRDDGYYWIRPDMVINVKDVDCLYGEDMRPVENVYENLIYYPSTTDFLNFLGKDFQQVINTIASGIWAYANGYEEDESIRSQGATVWHALANVVYSRFVDAQNRQNVVLTPTQVEASENVTVDETSF